MAELRQFVCAHCGADFLSPASDEEAEEERRLLWGGEPHEELDEIVCDECFQKAVGSRQ